MEKRAKALTNWKNVVNSPLPSWNLSNNNNNPCNGTALMCDEEGSVTEINLANSGLDGTLNRFDFSALSNLTALDLNMNNLVGAIPAGIGNATKLRFLDLSSNNLTFSIPPEMGNLLELQVLSLYNNSLLEKIPSQLSNLQNLWFLDLGANYLENPDPDEFKGMASIIELRLTYNDFSEIQSFVFDRPKLGFLDLSDNTIAVKLPIDLLAILGNLTNLNLTNKCLKGRFQQK